MIYEDEKPGHMAWTKAGQLIVLQNASLYPTKYDVSVKYHRKTLMYSLVIKNINMGDLNLVYKCESGFSSAEGILPLNEETFVGKYIYINITTIVVLNFELPYSIFWL